MNQSISKSINSRNTYITLCVATESEEMEVIGCAERVEGKVSEDDPHTAYRNFSETE